MTRLRAQLANGLENFVANDTAATAIEYALIASLVSVVIVGAVTAVGTALRDSYYDGLREGFESVNGG